MVLHLLQYIKEEVASCKFLNFVVSSCTAKSTQHVCRTVLPKEKAVKTEEPHNNLPGVTFSKWTPSIGRG